jgi:hypothetical protein
MLTGPFVIHYYDIAYFGEGITAANGGRAQRSSSRYVGADRRPDPHSDRDRHDQTPTVALIWRKPWRWWRRMADGLIADP